MVVSFYWSSAAEDKLMEKVLTFKTHRTYIHSLNRGKGRGWGLERDRMMVGRGNLDLNVNWQRKRKLKESELTFMNNRRNKV